MKLLVGLRDFIRMAGITLTLRFGMSLILLAGVTAGTIYGLWTTTAPWLDGVFSSGCTDKGAETGETTYVPSTTVTQCTQSADIAMLMLISIATALVLCGAITVLTYVIHDYLRRGNAFIGLPVLTEHENLLKVIRRSCSYVAFVMVLCIIMVIVSRG